MSLPSSWFVILGLCLQFCRYVFCGIVPITVHNVIIRLIYFLNLYYDRVHVVFGLVISGFEVIEQIENLKTDAASRPYADVRVIDCGVLATKLTKDGKNF